MKNRIVLLLMFCSVLFLKAQVPGYMGKRLSLGYSNYFFPALIGPGVNASSKSDNFGFNATHCINMDYTMKARMNLCFSFQIQNLGVTNNRSYYVETYNGFTNDYYYYEYDPIKYSPMKLKSYNVGIGFKFFSGQTFAPIGRYSKVELLLLFSNLTYASNSFSTYDNAGTGKSYASLGTGNYDFKTFAITYTMGRSRVLFDHIVLDYGLRIGAMPAGVFAFLNSDGDFSSGNLSYEKTFRQDTNMRLFRQQLINAHIGIGFLAF